MKTGIELIADERKEQIEKHGRTHQEDALRNKQLQMIDAAIGVLQTRIIPPEDWDAEIWNKMISKPIRGRVIIAGALLAAELDRINYVIENGDSILRR